MRLKRILDHGGLDDDPLFIHIFLGRGPLSKGIEVDVMVQDAMPSPGQGNG
jgi:hypothetical protein